VYVVYWRNFLIAADGTRCQLVRPAGFILLLCCAVE